MGNIRDNVLLTKWLVRLKRLYRRIFYGPVPTVPINCPICECDFNHEDAGPVMLYSQVKDWWIPCILVCDDEDCQEEAMETNSQFIQDMFFDKIKVRFIVLTPDRPKTWEDPESGDIHRQIGHQL